MRGSTNTGSCKRRAEQSKRCAAAGGNQTQMRRRFATVHRDEDRERINHDDTTAPRAQIKSRSLPRCVVVSLWLLWPSKTFCVRRAGERYLLSFGMRPSNRMAKWLRACFQWWTGIVPSPASGLQPDFVSVFSMNCGETVFVACKEVERWQRRCARIGAKNKRGILGAADGRWASCRPVSSPAPARGFRPPSGWRRRTCDAFRAICG